MYILKKESHLTTLVIKSMRQLMSHNHAYSTEVKSSGEH